MSIQHKFDWKRTWAWWDLLLGTCGEWILWRRQGLSGVRNRLRLWSVDWLTFSIQLFGFENTKLSLPYAFVSMFDYLSKKDIPWSRSSFLGRVSSRPMRRKIMSPGERAPHQTQQDMLCSSHSLQPLRRYGFNLKHKHLPEMAKWTGLDEVRES